MAAERYSIRKYFFTRWEETGFPKRVNHAVTSFRDDHGRGFMYSTGGFKGKGTVIPGGRGTEHWPELGRVPMDVTELNLSIIIIGCMMYTCTCRYLIVCYNKK